MDGEGYILFLAAEARELSGLSARKSGRKLDWPVQHAWMAGEAILAANGPGPQLAAQALREAASRAPVRAVVSVGYCGALDPDLAVGDMVLADCVLCEDGTRFAACLPDPQTRGSARVGTVISVDRVAVTAQEKRRLRASGACAVEMEAAGIARVAKELNVPFYSVRSVSDTAAEDMAIDFNLYRDATGRFSRARIAAAAVCKPARIPALRRFDANCRMASATLGGFLADCGF